MPDEDGSHDGLEESYGGHGITPSFLGIPQEVRMLIFDFLLGYRTFWINYVVERRNITSGIIGSLSILRVNKQIHREAARTLRVRTLRLNKFRSVDFGLLPQIPNAICRWTSTIDTILAGYGSREFEEMSSPRSDEHHDPRPLESLKSIVSMLPNLHNLTITVDDCFMSGSDEMERRLKRMARVLLPLMPGFNHISSTIKDSRRTIGLPEWNVTLTFRKLSKNTSNQATFHPKSPRIWLDVVNNTSKNGHWLTMDEDD